VPEGDQIQALRSRVIETVCELLNERRPAPEAARELDRLRTELVRLEVAIEPLVGLAPEWEYYPDRRPDIERKILSAADSVRRKVET
jgi:hypothetical protein